MVRVVTLVAVVKVDVDDDSVVVWCVVLDDTVLDAVAVIVIPPPQAQHILIGLKSVSS